LSGDRLRVVAALGGNALLRRGERPEADAQRANVARAVHALAAIAREHDLVVTHGNGPQVGLLALQASAYEAVAPYPLDVLGAETEGMIGYLLEQGLGNELPGRAVATLLTQVVVDPADPAFADPTKFVGPVYDAGTAQTIAAQHGWTVRPDGEHWRRVVPSPEPQRLVELPTIRLLVDAGVLVVCVGGGGVPVRATPDGALHGVEAVVDKDLAAALLARELEADVLLLLTDVPGIEVERGTPSAHLLRDTTPSALRRLALPAGSMGPKAEAAARFVEATGRPAAIASLTQAGDALRGMAGTIVRAGTDHTMKEAHLDPALLRRL
jgi:carbamate kinase